MNGTKRRAGIVIMGQLIGLVKPLLPFMIISVIMGTIGFLCAIFLTVLAGSRIAAEAVMQMPLSASGSEPALSGISGLFMERLLHTGPGIFCLILLIIAVLRGVLHYIEQYCNHYIAFRLLAIIRHKVFANLRRLCPAKLEGKNKGDLISLLTSDVELLEVFYAHTISPIAIAVVVSALMTVFIGRQSVPAGVLAVCAYLVVGVLIPFVTGKRGAGTGLEFRNAFGDLSGFVLDSMRGLDETIQYGDGKKHLDEMTARSDHLAGYQKKLSGLEAGQTSLTNAAILCFSFGMLFLMTALCRAGLVSFLQAVMAVIAMMSSFGPVVALSNLANSLNQTLASGERVLSVLEEEPVLEEVSDGKDPGGLTDVTVDQVSFGYDTRQILTSFSLTIPKGSVIGIHGPSGCGKSTLLKLLMRFWDPEAGRISISGTDLREVNTASLRGMESYMTQETHLFHDSIANNIAIGDPDADREAIIEAAKKASIHDFIMRLPDGYDTNVGELGDSLSGGERQRIGLARAFLHNTPLLLLDEPTSNLDSLNEGIILKSLQEAQEKKKQTIVLVSHRKSTLGMADRICSMDYGR